MTLAPGTRLGPYTITAELGHGGMGVVYTAHDPRLKRQVAIKLLAPDLTRDETAKQRFLQEAQAASALDHPNICTIYEINETPDGQLYLVMAYYEGETLKQRIERGPLALDEAVDIATQVGLGLAASSADPASGNGLVRWGNRQFIPLDHLILASLAPARGIIRAWTSRCSPSHPRKGAPDGRPDCFPLPGPRKAGWRWHGGRLQGPRHAP